MKTPGKMSRPTARVLALSMFASIGGGLFGGDTGSIGGITTMPFFEHDLTPGGPLSETLRGVVVASLLISSALSGIFAGNVADFLSRRYAMALGYGIFAAGMAIASASPNLGVLIAGRVVSGFGEGIFLSVCTTYITEIAPSRLRGRLIVLFQAATGAGITLGFFVCYGSVRIPSTWSWRLPMIMASAISGVAALVAPFLPESPRWLLSKGKKEEAERVLQYLIGSDPAQHSEREELVRGNVERKSGRFLDIFAKGVRGRTWLGVFLNVVQQTSGIDFLLFYAPLLFAQAGLDPKTASFVASGVTGMVLTGVVTLASTYIERIGRRPLFIAGGCGVALSQCVIGALYASGGHRHPAGRWTIIACLELFTISFGGTWSVIVRLYSAEIQPSATRAAATSFGIGLNQAVNTVVALTAPVFLARSASGPYWTYGSISLFASAVAYFIMPETLGKSLESIDTSFQESSAITTPWPKMKLFNQRRNESPAAIELRHRRPSHHSEAEAGTNAKTDFRRQMMGERLYSDVVE